MPQLAGYDIKEVTFNSSTSADFTAAAFVAPFGGVTILSAKAVSSTTLAAGTADFFSLFLLNGGTVGTATTALGTVGGTAAGGTAAAWTAATARAFTLNAALDELAAGEILMVKYDETGTVAVADITVMVQYVNGKG